ncbi:MAG: hypothetical protein LBC76_03820 [Treponema sp.]|jgi:hypothetical protein|nr:hypothetical protein [Treponema sp.]
MKKIAVLSSIILFAVFISIITGYMVKNNKKADKTKSLNSAPTPQYPFPHYTEYAVTPMLPDNKTKEILEDTIISLFRNILLNDLIIDSNAPQTREEFRMVIRHSQEWEVNEGSVKVSHINVSESQGYGMMIIAYMAGCEEKLNFSENNWILGSTSLKDYYDAMLRTVTAFPSIIAPRLFTWELFGFPAGEGSRTGYKIVNGIKTAPFTSNKKEGDSATDGDMDIIYSLIIADRQWGSGGKYNYIKIAKNMLDDLWNYCVNEEYHTLLLGDWAKNSAYGISANASRPSDFIISHLKVYKEIDSDHNWQVVIDATYNVIKEIRDGQNAEGSNNGLMPDFVKRGEAGWVIPDENFIEDYDGDFAYNACRVPWRLGTDYLLYGNTAIGSSSLYDLIIKPLDDFAIKYTGVNPRKLGPLFMNGKSFSWKDPDLFAPPFLVTAAAAGTSQEWVNALWNFSGLAKYNKDTYGDYIKLLVMLTVSGSYWRP